MDTSSDSSSEEELDMPSFESLDLLLVSNPSSKKTKKNDKEYYSAQLGKFKTTSTVSSSRKKPELNNKLVLEGFRPYLKLINEPRKCVNCRMGYTTVENLMNWRCFLHSGDYNHKTGKYICCGGGLDVLGCVPCMHTSNIDTFRKMRREPKSQIVSVPKPLVNDNILTVYWGMIVQNVDARALNVKNARDFVHVACVNYNCIRTVYIRDLYT